MKNLATRASAVLARLLVRFPRRILVVFGLLVVGAAILAAGLRINANQLELLNPDLRAVRDVKRVIDMIGGEGRFVVALRGADPAALEQVATALTAELEAEGHDVRASDLDLDLSFLRSRAALFLDTADLVEVRARVTRYLKDRAKRANPFFFEIVPTEPLELELDDLLEKYAAMVGGGLGGDGRVSKDGEMRLVVVRPPWDASDLSSTGALTERLRGRLAALGVERGLGLIEDYSPELPEDPKTVEFGFAGSYQLGYDEQFEIKRSLVPVGGVALLGIFGVLLVFFRRRVGAVLLVVTGLVAGIALAFGFAELAVGELNMVTSILAGILMGLGIDFGVHVVYRLREELGRGRSVRSAVLEAVTHQAPASFVSAAGIGAAFFSLLFSDFRGFSQFGLLAGAGVFLIGVAIYVWVPAGLQLLSGRDPARSAGRAAALIGTSAPRAPGLGGEERIPRPWLLLAGGLALVLGLGVFAPQVEFDHDTRSLSTLDQPSRRLTTEIDRRFEVTADPAAVYTPTLDDARRLHAALDQGAFETVAQVVSVFSLVPPEEQQAKNAAILADWKADLEKVDPALLPEAQRGWFEEALAQLEALPFTLEDLPAEVRRRFTARAGASPENRGWLTFVYPSVATWDDREIRRFLDEVDSITVEGGGVFHAAGQAVLRGTLVEIVLADARVSVFLTSLLLLVILLVDLRSIGKALLALVPLAGGVAVTFGFMALTGLKLNFMNIVVFPIVLGYGVSHGVYLMHRLDEGASPRAALRSVGLAVLVSTLTTLAGWAALMVATHRGLQSMGLLAVLGMAATLLVSFTVMPAVMQLVYDRRLRYAAAEVLPGPGGAGGRGEGAGSDGADGEVERSERVA